MTEKETEQTELTKRLAITERVKDQFDSIQRKLIAKEDRYLSQDEVLEYLISFYETLKLK